MDKDGEDDRDGLSLLNYLDSVFVAVQPHRRFSQNDPDRSGKDLLFHYIYTNEDGFYFKFLQYYAFIKCTVCIT